VIKKSPSRDGRTCKVVFQLPAAVGVDKASVCGEFNEWSSDVHVMTRQKDGSFRLAVTLPGGRSYRYRYLLNGQCWYDDDAADGYEPNPYGSKDCVLHL
jgi:1,4-alpha-glucan branching enzyme